MFLGPVKWHRAVRRVPFGDLDLPASKALRTEPYNILHINLLTSGIILDAYVGSVHGLSTYIEILIP
jgi:hypothetical protein